MENVSIVGLDLVKNVLQAHGECFDGSVAFRMKISRANLQSLFRFGSEMSRGHGSLRRALYWHPGDLPEAGSNHWNEVLLAERYAIAGED